VNFYICVYCYSIDSTCFLGGCEGVLPLPSSVVLCSKLFQANL
jgi:hypothetical protein